MTDAQSFWDLAAPYLASGECDEGTIMGHACLRKRGEFVAMYWARGGGLVVKLDAPTAAAHIALGQGREFAPAGRPFREWLTVPVEHREQWPELLAEAVRLCKVKAR